MKFVYLVELRDEDPCVYSNLEDAKADLEADYPNAGGVTVTKMTNVLWIAVMGNQEYAIIKRIRLFEKAGPEGEA